MFFSNKSLATGLLAFSCLAASAQQMVHIKVNDQQTQQPLKDVAVQMDQQFDLQFTDSNGSCSFLHVPKGQHILRLNNTGYVALLDTIQVDQDLEKSYSLQAETHVLDAVIVTSTRVDENSTMTYSSVSKEDLAKQNMGQDLPFLLNSLPSVVTTSDAGAGVGYTGIRIRGSDATRVNVTINGIPVNDAESQGTYWVDLPDIASSIDNIQLQRGVGTSTNGAGAFGGSMNIETTKLNPKPYGEYNGAGGSFGTLKNTVQAGTGLLNNQFAMDVRLSKINSNGFIDRASSDLGSYYLSGAYYGKKSLVKFITFSGVEETYQAWNGIPESRLRGDRQGMLDYIVRNGLDAEDSANLVNSNSRTYNQFTYKNQVDHYRQTYYQLHSSHSFTPFFNLNTALHYTKGLGYYEEYRKGDNLSDYGLDPVILGSDTITQTNLVRRRWLNNDFYGVTFSGNYDNKKDFAACIGGAVNRYVGSHYGEIIWAQYASNSQNHDRYYADTASKSDMTFYAKMSYQVIKGLHVYADLQYRSINYSFLGFDDSLKNVTQSAQLGFVNPKAGINYSFNPNIQLYFSYSKGSKEPGRDDYTQSSPSSRPLPEKLNDLELGYRHKVKKMAWSINLFDMLYKDQLVLTGEINDVGAYNRTNVKTSYRRGIEAEFEWQLIKKLSWSMNATLSQNKIEKFAEYIDNYDSTAQRVVQHPNTDIAFSPKIIAKSILSYSPIKGAEIAFNTTYVGQQYLDNTQDESRKLDAYLVNDLRLSYSFHTKLIPEIGFSVSVMNLFNEEYESNGYTWGYIYGGIHTVENFYYPQAGRNILAGIHVKF